MSIQTPAVTSGLLIFFFNQDAIIMDYIINHNTRRHFILQCVTCAVNYA